MEQLSEDEIDTLARVSYAYWAWEKLNPDSDRRVEFRSKSARFEIHRYRVAESGNDAKALNRIKTAIAWRNVRCDQKEILLDTDCFHTVLGGAR